MKCASDIQRSLWAVNTLTQQSNRPFLLGTTIFAYFQIPSQRRREAPNSGVFMQTGAAAGKFTYFPRKFNRHHSAVYHKDAVNTRPKLQLDSLEITPRSWRSIISGCPGSLAPPVGHPREIQSLSVQEGKKKAETKGNAWQERDVGDQTGPSSSGVARRELAVPRALDGDPLRPARERS